MMTILLLLLDPTVFQSTVLAWIGVATVIAGALSGFAALIIAQFNKLKATAVAEDAKAKADAAAEKAVAVDARLERQGARMETLQQTVTQVALATPPNGNVVPVDVQNKEPINVKEV